MSSRRFILHTGASFAAIAACVIASTAHAGLLGGIGSGVGGTLNGALGGSIGSSATQGTLGIAGSGSAQSGLVTPGGAVLQPIEKARGAASSAKGAATSTAGDAKNAAGSALSTPPGVSANASANASTSANGPTSSP
jgi:hypothetical protein